MSTTATVAPSPVDALHDSSALIWSRPHRSGRRGSLVAAPAAPAVATRPTAQAAAEWHRATQAEIVKMVWAHPAITHSYFKNADGEIHTVSPWRLDEYWAAVREPDWSQFIITKGDRS